MPKFVFPFVFILSSALLTGCGSSDSEVEQGTTDLDVAVEQLVDNTILPAIASLQTEATALSNNVNSFCTSGNANLTEDNLSALQTQWHTSNLAWYKVSPFKFGPIIQNDDYFYINQYHSRGNDNISSVRSYISIFLANTDAISTTSDKSGLTTLEVALFESSTQSQLAADIVTEFQDNPRKCVLLTGHSDALLVRINSVVNGWNSDYQNTGKSYRDLLVNQELENYFSAFLDDGDGTPAMERITLAVQDYLDLLTLDNHDITSEKDTFANGEIWNALNASVESVEDILAGTSETSVSLFDVMNNNGHEQNVSTVTDNISTFKTALSETNSVNFTAAAAALDGNFKNAIPDSLNISLGLTFTDGDG